MGRTREAGLGGAVVALSAACGLLVGMRSILALDGWGVRPLLGLPAIPVERLGVSWSVNALWPAELQAAALERMAGLLAALFLAAVAVALLNAVVLLVEAGTARWREVAVRAALGAGPFRLVGLLLAHVRRLVGAGVGLGLLLGLATAGALRSSWPALTADPALLAGAGSLSGALALAAAAAAAAYAAVGFRTLRRGALAPALGSGERTTSDRGAVLLRRLLSAAQGGAAGALLLGSLALALSLGGATHGGGGDLKVLPVTAPPGAGPEPWAALLGEVGGVPGVAAESLAAPGALVGLGVRDHVLAQCGNCFKGGLPLPFWGAIADHYAVTPGFVAQTGLEMVAGRDLDLGDAAGSEPVALVNETFARTSFEEGRPLGRKIRVGTDMDGWYTVVGIVSDGSVPVVGGDDLDRPAVYLSAFQRPPTSARLLFRADDEAARRVVSVASAGGYMPGALGTLSDQRRAASAPLAWIRGVALFLGGLALLLALHGAHLTALQVTRRQARELAVRRALGASDRAILLHVLRRAAWTGLGAAFTAVFLGSLLVAFLRKAAGGVEALHALPYVAVAGLLVATVVTASVRAAREAVRVPPGRAVAQGRGGFAEPIRAGSGS